MIKGEGMYHFTGCGLDYIWLLDGFERHETSHGVAVRIHDLEGLHAAIARSVVTSQERIRGQEVRFLRSMLNLSQEGLGRLLDQSRATVARWEGEPARAIPKTCDKWLRVVYTQKVGGDRDVCRLVELLTDLDEQKHGDRTVRFTDRSAGWRSEAERAQLVCA